MDSAWLVSFDVGDTIASVLLAGESSNQLTCSGAGGQPQDANALAAHLRSHSLDQKLAEVLYPDLQKLATAEAPAAGDLQSKFAGVEMSYPGSTRFTLGLRRIGALQAACERR